MNIDRECERIENNPNLTDEEKSQRIADLEQDARDMHGQYLAEREELDRKYGY